MANVTVMCRMALTGLLALGCATAPLTEIAEGWYVDQGPPGKPSPHLYRDVDGTRVLVDRQIEAYRMYYTRCLVYQVSRPEGRVLYGVNGNLTPLAIATSDALDPWRLDTEGLRRFGKPADPDGRNLLTVESMNVGEICTALQMQPPFTENWAAASRVKPGRFKVIESVLDVNGADSVGNSTLSDAAGEGQIATVDALLRAGADANSANDAGITVLMVAVAHRHPDVARRLLKGGARVNAQDDRGQTALMAAARYRNAEMAQLLLDAGADIRVRDDSGQNAVGKVPDGGGAETQLVRERLQRAAAAIK
jgi:hypothetical protein